MSCNGRESSPSVDNIYRTHDCARCLSGGPWERTCNRTLEQFFNTVISRIFINQFSVERSCHICKPGYHGGHLIDKSHVLNSRLLRDVLFLRDFFSGWDLVNRKNPGDTCNLLENVVRILIRSVLSNILSNCGGSLLLEIRPTKCSLASRTGIFF